MIRRLIKHLVVKNGEVRAPSNNFHIIRYSLAVFVVYSHSYGLLGMHEPGLLYYTFGALAVKCFFCLSGYLIALSCVRTASLSSYAWNRTLRIFPALFVAMIASYYIGSHFDHFITNPVPYIVNGPVWTLAWEVFCYFLCGLLWWMGLLTRSSLGPIIVISWMLYIIYPSESETAVVVVPLMLLFFLGAYISLIKEKINFTYIGPLSLLVLALVSIDTKLVGLTWFFGHVPFLYGPDLPLQKYQTLAFLFSLPFFMIWLAYLKPIMNLRNDYSYGIYILAWPVQQVLVTTLTPNAWILFIPGRLRTALQCSHGTILKKELSCLSANKIIRIKEGF